MVVVLDGGEKKRNVRERMREREVKFNGLKEEKWGMNWMRKKKILMIKWR